MNEELLVALEDAHLHLEEIPKGVHTHPLVDVDTEVQKISNQILALLNVLRM